MTRELAKFVARYGDGRGNRPTPACLKPAPGPDDARAMIEMLGVLFVVGLAAALGLVGALVPAEWVVRVGWICTAAGLLLVSYEKSASVGTYAIDF